MIELLETYEEVQREFEKFQFLMPDWDISIRPMDYLPNYGTRGFQVVITVDTFDTYTYREPEVTGRPSMQVKTYAWGTVTISAARFAREDLNPRIQIQHVTPRSLPIPKDVLPHFARQCIHAALQHEADEWIRVDGVMIYNPHEGQVRL